MRSPACEIERTLKDGTTVSVHAYGRYAPAERHFPEEILDFEIRVFRDCGGECGRGCSQMCKHPKELFEKDIPIEWERLQGAAMDAISEPLEEAV